LAEYTYQAKTREGYVVQGIVDAQNESSAVDILHAKGYVILALEAAKATFDTDVSQIFSRPSNKDLVIFTRQLSTLIDADMPLSEGLRTLARQVEKASFRRIISDVADSVEGGSLLSAALAQYPNLFSNFYIKLIQSGEVSGKLHDSLLYLAEYVERSQAINSKIRGALAYPAFIIFSLLVVSILMVTFVLPELLKIFKESGATDLPITTKILIWVTDLVNDNLLLFGVMIAGMIFLGIYFFRTPDGKIWLDNLKIKFPTLGGIVRNLYLARIAESLATLMKSGIPILDSLRITADLVGNVVYRKVMLDAEESVKSGGTISSALAKYKEIPPLFSSMVSIGERTGKMDFILDHISKFYKSESEQSIETISQIIEPALILILGVAVAGLVSSILLPIYNIVSGA
jgi:type II secretory pathway component PulF